MRISGNDFAARRSKEEEEGCGANGAYQDGEDALVPNGC